MGSKLAAAFWTAKEPELRERWAQGESAEAVAKALGGGVTRSAVIGKANRLGLKHPKPRTRIVGNSPESRKKAAETRRLNRKKNPRYLSRSQQLRLPRVDPGPEPAAMVASLIELPNRGACHWPQGDGPNFLFCGAATLASGVYCVHHALRASIRTEIRRESTA